MKRFLTVSGAILRKDCWHLWPQAAPTAALVAISNAAFAEPAVRGVLQLAALLVCAFLVVRLIQSDSAVSVQHDWLTRPIPWAALLLAKGVFVILWILLPDLLGATLQGLRDAYSLDEALLAAIPQSVPSPLVLALVAAAVFTSSLWEAMLVIAASAVLYIVAVSYVLRSKIMIWMDMVYASSAGSGWIVEWTLGGTALMACLLLLWRQYGPRRTLQARALYGGALVMMLLLPALLLPESRTVALQRKLGPGSALADRLMVGLVPGCFATKLIKSSRDIGTLGMPPGNVLMGSLKPGRDALVFSTVLTSRGPVQAGGLLVAHPLARYVDAKGSTLFTVDLLPGRPQVTRMADGRPAITHYWLLQRARYEELMARPDVRLQLDYSLSLLVPRAQVDTAPDSNRRFYSGIGYCGVRSIQDSVVVSVDCFKPGPQPAWVLFSEAGAALNASTTDVDLDFKPALLGMLDGKRHKQNLILQDLKSSRVRITAYEVGAHFLRQVTAPGVLGGSNDSCPAPTAAGN
jgi:hypothetical protein